MLNIKESPNYVPFVLSFCSKDEIRSNLRKPVHYEDGFVFAANTTVLLAFNDQNFHNLTESKLFGSIPSLPDGRNKRVFDGYESLMNKDAVSLGEIKMADVDKVLEQIRQEYPEYRYKYDNCTKCKGEGRMYCDCCENHYDCSMCDGEGTIIVSYNSTNGYFKYPFDQVFIVKDRMYSISVMASISESLKLVGADTLDVLAVNQDVNKIFTRIKDSEFYLVIMGLSDNHNPEGTHLLLD